MTIVERTPVRSTLASPFLVLGSVLEPFTPQFTPSPRRPGTPCDTWRRVSPRNEAGLTNGTFYTHFKSKEALVREALLRSLDPRHEDLAQLLLNSDAEALIRAYLSPEHRDDPGAGCVVAALASEVSRHPRATRQTFSTHSARTLDAIAASLLSRKGKKAKREDAAVFMGLLSGTLQIARATPDRDESDAILEAGIQAAIRMLK